MTTVTITGSGTPVMVPGRAGPGVLVRSGDVAVQFDCGRATSLRLAEAGQDLTRLDAVALTHHHSDHVSGLTELLLSRWLEAGTATRLDLLPVIVPEGMGSRLVSRLLDPWQEEIGMRDAHIGYASSPDPQVIAFAAPAAPETVWERGSVSIDAVAVRHQPVVPAVGYRINTAEGIVVISGDTAVCDEMEDLAGGANVLIHEAFRLAGVAGLLSDPAAIAAYHADTVELGGMASRAGVHTLVLTHLIPPPADEADEAAFVADIRRGGFTGSVVVARDLTEVAISRT